MRKLLATTSLSLALAGAAIAQSGNSAGVSASVQAGTTAENGVAETTNDVAEAGKDAAGYLKKKTSEAGEAIEKTWDKTKEAATGAYDATKDATGKVADTVAETYDEISQELKELVAVSSEEGYELVEPEVLVASELEGQPVYDIDNKRIGEIAKVETDATGQVEAATIEVGGFLGIGESEVKVRAAEIGVVQNDQAELRVYVTATEQELEQRAELQNS